ncbi:ABC transporter permease [Chloroflexus sp.]|uniref:ABC transporter permease n=1 Tax=Chloroflexus sp. TaxID=1904827 RepID=UPI00298F1164|nr:ABC transporter permease [Chloroflexus sp.]MDW8405324.1 ABC transporter permease [Chloroflexus sp.]
MQRTTQISPFGPLIAFARAQLYVQIRNWRYTAATLFTPMFLLVLFKLTMNANAASMMPILVGFGVMYSGQTLGLILITWRNNRVFTRFAATPTPISHLLFATVIVQLIVFLLQSIVLLMTGIMLYDARIAATDLPMVLAILSVGCLTFLGFGALIAAFVSKADTLSMIYVFTLLPMIFLGGSVFVIPGLGEIGRWLPPTVLTYALNPYFGFGEVDGGQIAGNLAALLIYSGIFTVIAALSFQTGE